MKPEKEIREKVNSETKTTASKVPRESFIEEVCVNCPEFNEKKRNWRACELMLVCVLVEIWEELKKLREQGGEA